ncbi:hypothetical protein BDBG_07702 [Blastomyces gilchristii SLH14081]|uniref:Uncharacterized protein n=1 Tax=Blastomyces gilchristii (strain SLH14081) TaxID=559298 RepID=A0A179UWB7_BLAGS|nr:uncharacterized protein BDBG_07702 [Blastomyces gilchristii SLH14081]OAT12344.1 hypothetical protein BDBG_07702 [Blastomyces gilchristii SLH14081]
MQAPNCRTSCAPAQQPSQRHTPTSILQRPSSALTSGALVEGRNRATVKLLSFQSAGQIIASQHARLRRTTYPTVQLTST